MDFLDAYLSPETVAKMMEQDHYYDAINKELERLGVSGWIKCDYGKGFNLAIRHTWNASYRIDNLDGLLEALKKAEPDETATAYQRHKLYFKAAEKHLILRGERTSRSA